MTVSLYIKVDIVSTLYIWSTVVSKYGLEKSVVEKMVTSGLGAEDIARHFGCSLSWVYVFCKQNEINWPQENLVGKKFNQLEVKYKSRSGDGAVYWMCLCSCGKLKELSTATVNAGKQISCGCYLKSKERSRNNRLWSGYGDIHGRFWAGMKRGAKTRGHVFEISIEYAWDLFLKQNGRCLLTGVDIFFATTGRDRERGMGTASLDRIDSGRGYVIGNVQWVHKTVNLMKQGLPEAEFLNWCRLVASYKNHDGLG